jgi:hypothetical protein
MRPCTPMTNDQVSVPNHLATPTERDNTVAPPNGSINLMPCRSPYSQISKTIKDRSHQQSVSPGRAANISVRRSALLQSPARAGYTTRMRQIFEDAGRGHPELHCSPDHLYPQLPNISRKASPSPVRSPSQNRINSSLKLCLASSDHSEKLSLIVAATDKTFVNHPHASERSSGSWSDDSGYIIAASRVRGGSFVIPLDERIHQWLADLSDTKTEEHAQNDSDEAWRLASPIKQHGRCSAPFPPSLNTAQGEATPSMSLRDDRSMLLPTNWSSSNDLYMCDADSRCYDTAPLSSLQIKDTIVTESGRRPSDNETSIHTSLDRKYQQEMRTPSPIEGIRMSSKSYTPKPDTNMLPSQNEVLEEDDIQLSPLSPNVCVERGPSRYHSDRRPRDMTTPCKGRPVVHFGAPRLKENMVVDEGDGDNENGLFIFCHNRLSTSLRRQQ